MLHGWLLSEICGVHKYNTLCGYNTIHCVDTQGCEVRLQNCDTWLLASSYMSVRLPFRMEHVGSHWSDFHEMLKFEYFSKNSIKY
jgi:hypothetical protein